MDIKNLKPYFRSNVMKIIPLKHFDIVYSTLLVICGGDHEHQGKLYMILCPLDYIVLVHLEDQGGNISLLRGSIESSL
jgi:hypothetical protein